MHRALAALGVVLAAGGCGGSDEHDAKSSFVAQGVRFEAPDGWYGRATDLPVRGVRPKAFVQVASFPLEQPPPKSLRRDQALITLAEDYGLVAVDAPLADARSPLRRSEFAPASSPRVPAGQTLAERAFSVHGRNFRLSVSFGAPPGDYLLARVNGVLASLVVRRPPPRANRGIATATTRLRACRGRGFGELRGLKVAEMSCGEAARLTGRFAPHPSDVVERLGDFTCYSLLMPRQFLRVVCMSGPQVFRFNFY
jgi:hypothetical protein